MMGYTSIFKHNLTLWLHILIINLTSLIIHYDSKTHVNNKYNKLENTFQITIDKFTFQLQ